MESLATLGVVCNIFQFISFGGEAIRMAKTAYQTGSVEGDLANYTARLTSLSINLEQSFTNCSGLQGQDEKDLIVVAKQCLETALTLQAEINTLSLSCRGNALAVW